MLANLFIKKTNFYEKPHKSHFKEESSHKINDKNKKISLSDKQKIEYQNI